MGDTGTGKTRWRDVVGGLCYRSCSISGAVTPAPIYRLINKWGGTLLIDESDWGASDEKSELVKILNCGFQRNNPVMRCLKDDPDKLQYLPVFGPKLIVTRYSFSDKALEARCLTNVMEETSRTDIPVELGRAFRESEAKLRNKLMLFRLRNRNKVDPEAVAFDEINDLEPRLRQMIGPFSVLANIEGLREDIVSFAKRQSERVIEERSGTLEGEIVSALLEIGPDAKTTPQSVADRINQGRAEKDKLNHRVIGRHMKALNLRVKKTRDGSKTLNLLVWDAALMDKLRKRYVPSVPCVPSVVESPIQSVQTTLSNGTNRTTEHTKAEIARALREKDIYTSNDVSEDDVVDMVLRQGVIHEVSPGRYVFV
jgi:hypothetical protein